MVEALITPEAAREALGAPFLVKFVASLEEVRDDLNVFRDALPTDWYPQWTDRALASFIHDRLWVRLTTDIDSIDCSVSTSDNGTTRSLCVNDRVVLRVKRHNADGQISGYRTPTSEKFYMGELAGMEAENLAIGYEWFPFERQIGRAVLSKQASTGKDPLWAVGIGAPGTASEPIPFDTIIPPQVEFDFSGIAAAAQAEEDAS